MRSSRGTSKGFFLAVWGMRAVAGSSSDSSTGLRAVVALALAIRTASTAASRSAADNFDDYIRGVETVNDPYYGTSQHASTEQYHWTDGYGSYRHSNDPSADPNRTEVGQWQRMEPVR